MKDKNLLLGVVGVVVTLATIYGLVYVSGRAWKSSQK